MPNTRTPKYLADRTQVALRNRRIVDWAIKSMPAGAIDAIRSLNVQFVIDFMKRRGTPLVASRSEMTGQPMSVEAIALMTCHQLRTALGTATQVEESYKWLRFHGFAGLFGDVSHLAN
jgi:hypothetical protein